MREIGCSAKAETTLKSLSKTAVAAENFELPKDYAQKTMAESRGPPGGPPGK